MKFVLFFGVLFVSLQLPAQETTTTFAYTAPPDPLVRAKLAEWNKIKFGLPMH